jgi:hypothetical protein
VKVVTCPNTDLKARVERVLDIASMTSTSLSKAFVLKQEPLSEVEDVVIAVDDAGDYKGEAENKSSTILGKHKRSESPEGTRPVRIPIHVDGQSESA